MINVFEYYTTPKELEVPDFGDNAKLAFEFAYSYLVVRKVKGEILKSKKLEHIIAKSPLYSLNYALQILQHCSFKEGELAIASNAYTAYTYARYVIEGRWPEAESVIAKDAEYSYMYAKDIIKGRWSECENNLLHGQGYDHDGKLFQYIRDILKERWPAAELRIKNSRYKESYEKTFNVNL
jgi:hypothetical protein